jgi:hypothetical protein
MAKHSARRHTLLIAHPPRQRLHGYLSNQLRPRIDMPLIRCWSAFLEAQTIGRSRGGRTTKLPSRSTNKAVPGG